MDMSLSELRELVMDMEAWRAVVYEVTNVGHEWATELDWLTVLTMGFPRGSEVKNMLAMQET